MRRKVKTWKLARIQPIKKKGDSSNVKNYRPIAIASVLSKIMEKVTKFYDT